VSPNWTFGLVAVGIVCICLISYATYRYYQISVGHFKVNQNTNIILPVLPLAPPVPIPEQPPSMLDVFNAEFPTLMKARNDISVEGTNILIKQQIYLDFAGKATFVGFYIPISSDPISGISTYKMCMMLADQAQEALDNFARNIKMQGGWGLDANTFEELTFTGRVLIYHGDSLSITQKAEIINAYKPKHLDVQFRGEDYLMGQIDIWRRQRDSQQNHQALRPPS
jgi:hypothetical protein